MLRWLKGVICLARGNGGNWKYRMAQWMMGRYGVDSFMRALVVFACVLIVINFFVNSGIISTLSFAIMIYALFRCYSKNIPARRRELEAFERVMKKPKAWWRLTNKRYENRHTTIYFKCKGCGAMLNIPKGKGKLRVTCPKCGTVVEKKS